MPNLIKIGMTNRDPFVRADEISSSTGIPVPFKVEYFAETMTPEKLEKAVHKDLKKHRITNNREFFEIDVETATKTINHLGGRPGYLFQKDYLIEKETMDASPWIEENGEFSEEEQINVKQGVETRLQSNKSTSEDNISPKVAMKSNKAIQSKPQEIKWVVPTDEERQASIRESIRIQKEWQKKRLQRERSETFLGKCLSLFKKES